MIAWLLSSRPVFVLIVAESCTCPPIVALADAGSRSTNVGTLSVTASVLWPETPSLVAYRVAEPILRPVTMPPVLTAITDVSLEDQATGAVWMGFPPSPKAVADAAMTVPISRLDAGRRTATVMTLGVFEVPGSVGSPRSTQATRETATAASSIGRLNSGARIRDSP